MRSTSGSGRRRRLVSDPAMPAEALRETLAAALREAMKARETVTVETLRSLLSALDNASAVAAPARPAPVEGLSADTPRHEPSLAEIQEIFAAERAERESAAANYRRLGLDAESERLSAQLEVIERFWPEDTP
jgi:uncharacterized protein YqeY